MLSRLSNAATRTFFSAIEVGEVSSSDCEEEGEVLNVNVGELYTFVRPLPQLAWCRVSDLCARTVAPVYHAFKTTLHDDVEGLAQLFVDLEVSSAEAERGAQAYFEPAERDVLPTRLKRCQGTADLASLPIQQAHRRNRSSTRSRSPHTVTDRDAPLVVTNPDPALPTIVVTPCPSLPRSEACLVPYQDAAFGNRLPVPTHPALNDVFPPLVAKPFPLVERWRYEDGHWRAQLPPVHEQMRKGMFSRPLSTRRQRALLERDASGRAGHASRGRIIYSRGSHREG